MTEVLLHIGMGKSGSSALQAFLSSKPNQPIQGTSKKLRYIAFTKNGKFFHGKQLKKLANIYPSHYISSVNFQHIKNWNPSQVATLKNLIHNLSNNGNNLPILSSESWCLNAKYYIDLNLNNTLQIAPSAICYIRNPIELVNSAWWQWGAWMNISFDTFLDKAIYKIQQLPKALENWEKITNGKLQVYPLPNDIILDFCNKFDLLIPKKSFRSNKSLPAEILRLYQLYPELRSGPHDAFIDFVLSELIPFNKNLNNTPWILSSNNILKIFKHTHKSIEQIHNYLDKESLHKIEKDPRWYDPNAFKKYNVESPEISSISPSIEAKKIEYLLKESFKSLVYLRKEIIHLNTKLN